MSVRGVDVEAPLGGTMLIIANDDQPGVIGEVGTILGRHGVNIANFALGRGDDGAIGVVNVDEDAGAPQRARRGGRGAAARCRRSARRGSCGSSELDDWRDGSPISPHRDPQRARDGRAPRSRVPACDRLAVDVKDHRLVGFDRHLADPAGSSSRGSRSTVPLNSRGSWQIVASRDALLDHHQIEQPVVDARARRDARAVAELRGVRDRHEDGARVDASRRRS